MLILEELIADEGEEADEDGERDENFEQFHVVWRAAKRSFADMRSQAGAWERGMGLQLSARAEFPLLYSFTDPETLRAIIYNSPLNDWD